MDRFHRGLLSGLAGGIVMNIWSFISFYILAFTDRRFLDWAAVLLYGHLPRTLPETMLALLAQLIWAGFLGIIFAYFLPGITSRGYIIKGLFWGFISAFLIYAIAILIRMPYFNKIAFNTVLSQLIGGLAWGLTLTIMLRWLDRSAILEEE